MPRHVAEIDSSAIERAAQDDELQTLDLRYKGGDRYTYFAVPTEVLLSASSAGEYVKREIKPRYRYEIEDRHRRHRPNPGRA